MGCFLTLYGGMCQVHAKCVEFMCRGACVEKPTPGRGQKPGVGIVSAKIFRKFVDTPIDLIRVREP